MGTGYWRQKGGVERKGKRDRGREREGDRVSRAGVLRLGDANSPAVASPAARLPASRSFIISVDKTEAHGPGLAM